MPINRKSEDETDHLKAPNDNDAVKEKVKKCPNIIQQQHHHYHDLNVIKISQFQRHVKVCKGKRETCMTPRHGLPDSKLKRQKTQMAFKRSSTAQWQVVSTEKSRIHTTKRVITYTHSASPTVDSSTEFERNPKKVDKASQRSTKICDTQTEKLVIMNSVADTLWVALWCKVHRQTTKTITAREKEAEIQMKMSIASARFRALHASMVRQTT